MALPAGLTPHERTNAILGWTLAGFVVLGAVASVLANDVLWGGLALFAVAVMAIPALSTGDWTAVVPWPLLLVVAAAVLVRPLAGYHEAAGYVAVAALALVVVVELDAFTPVEMSRRFAVAFAVMTTVALQGLWTVTQFYSDRWLGTGFLSSQVELQWDFVLVTVVGLVVGGVFEWYFGLFSPSEDAEQPSESRGMP